MIQTETYLVDIGTASLELAPLLDFVSTEECGAVNIFIGTVRNTNEGRAVTGLDYEGYPEMCLRLLQEIVEEAFEQWPLARAAAVHRLGTIGLREAAVIVVTGSVHRTEAFAASRAIIDNIKHHLPIWKKEHYVDGAAEWVRCHH